MNYGLWLVALPGVALLALGYFLPELVKLFKRAAPKNLQSDDEGGGEQSP